MTRSKATSVPPAASTRGALGIEGLLTLHDNDHNRRGYQAGHGHKKASKGQSKGYAKF